MIHSFRMRDHATRGRTWGPLCRSRVKASLRSLSAIGVLFVVNCSSPSEHFDRQSEALGFRREVVQGTHYPHAVYRKGCRASGTVHIYLDGDGVPWIAGRPSDDPTSRHPLVLRLMQLDPAPAVYLGRPCYNGFAAAPLCASRLWTSARYGEEVVASMAAATRRILEESGYDRVVWVGHSGGGALAMLLAERVPQTTAVVTIAANLDTEAWAAYRGFDLADSLNPARRPPLPSDILQIHYAGSSDGAVPPAITAQGVTGGPTKLFVIEGYDHVCCWKELWPSVLARIAERLGKNPKGRRANRPYRRS
jgi:alpha/beta hydrolase family protein